MLNKKRNRVSPTPGSLVVNYQIMSDVNNNVYKIVNTLLIYKCIGIIVASLFGIFYIPSLGVI